MGYAAGCTFQDAPARKMSSSGVKMVSIDLPIINSAGCVHENSTVKLSGAQHVLSIHLVNSSLE